MIEGNVNARREAVVTLALQGPTGRTMEVDAVVDTGYSRFLTLPPRVVTELGLRRMTSDYLRLADGSEAPFGVYPVTVLWDGQPRQITAHESNNIPLIGMALLEWHNLNIDVRLGGQVAIRAIP